MIERCQGDNAFLPPLLANRDYKLQLGQKRESWATVDQSVIASWIPHDLVSSRSFLALMSGVGYSELSLAADWLKP